MSNENVTRLIGELVDTRINGNSIERNVTYSKMLKRIPKGAIESYAWGVLACDVYGSKLEMIEQIVDHYKV